MLNMCLAIKCYTVCNLDIYICIILMSCHCYVMFDLAFALVLFLVLNYPVLSPSLLTTLKKL